MTSKEIIRSRYQSRAEELALGRETLGKVAQRLRGAAAYRNATLLFVAPDLCLRQIRINGLLDGKMLLMPGPGLKAGFYLLRPYEIPFRHVSRAVTPNGLAGWGQCLTNQETADLSVDLMLTTAVVVDHAGGRLGDGLGFFDLAGGLLAELGCLGPQTRFIAAVGDGQLVAEPLPREPWDIVLHGLVTPTTVHEFVSSFQRLQVFWDEVEFSRIRKMEPLWRLWQQRHPKPL